MSVKYVGITSEQDKILKECYKKSIEVLRYCHIQISPLKDYKLKLHSRQCCGLCNYTEKIISVGEKYIKWVISNNKIHELVNTIIHEMLHVIAYECYNCSGHTKEWKQLAEVVTDETEYKIERMLDAKNSVSYQKELPKRKKIQPKYIVSCECGAKFYYTRKTKVIKQMEMGMSNFLRCPKCGGNHFTLEDIYYLP